MEREIVRDMFFLQQKSQPVTAKDLPLVQDLADTFRAHRSHCAGMAGNMIGYLKRMIIAADGPLTLVMLNPVIIQKKKAYETEEGCLSLPGVRKTTRYRNIEVEYLDSSWKKHRQKYSGWTAQIIQHELDHLEGRII